MRFARSRSAGLFISLHADALPRREGQAEGATVNTLSQNASDAEAARLAEAANKADVIAGVDLTSELDDVANILVDLAQRETKTFSMQFARTIVRRAQNGGAAAQTSAQVGGLQGSFRHRTCRPVLVELGYMSTKDDLRQLTSASWRAKLTALGVAQAVDNFLTPRV